MCGADRRQRSVNLLVGSQALCQLSYVRSKFDRPFFRASHKLVWKAGFEPAASRFQGEYSDQAELLPVNVSGDKVVDRDGVERRQAASPCRASVGATRLGCTAGLANISRVLYSLSYRSTKL